MEILDIFKRQLIAQKGGASKSTLKNYLSDVRHFISWFENITKTRFTVQSITADIITLYEKSMGGNISGGVVLQNTSLSVASMKRHLSSLRKFSALMQEEGLIADNPFENITPIPTDAPTDYWHLRSFKDYLLQNSASKLTIKNYLSDIQGFSRWYEEAVIPGIADPFSATDGFYLITQSVIEEYKKRLAEIQGAAPRTINRKLSSLRKYIEFASSKGFITKDELSIDPIQLSNEKQMEDNTAQINLQDIKAVEKETTRTYSKFPPKRLAQKLLVFPYLRAEDVMATQIAKVFSGKEYVGGIPLPKRLQKNIKAKNAIRNENLTIQELLGVRNVGKEFFDPQNISLSGLPPYKKFLHHIRYTRPNWYKRYHNYPFVHYIHFALLVIFAAGVGVALYQNLVVKKQIQSFAAPVAPPRVLSFQGRLTDNLDNPITSPTDIRFAIYNDLTASGGALLWQEVQFQVQPDQDGIFSVLLGSNTAIPSTVFTDNASIYLGVTIKQTSELTPRQRIASVAYASNSEFLQGMPPITAGGTSNVILALDSSGNLTIGGAANPTFTASGGQFKISGQPLVLATNTGSNGNIIVAPDNLGKIDVQKPLVNTTGNGNLVPGAVEVDDKFAVLATESAVAAFTVNNNTSGGDILTASSSGTTRFTIANDGTLTATHYNTAGGILFANGSGIFAQTIAGTTGQCLQSSGGSTPGWGTCGSGGNWTIANGSIYPINNTLDLLIGGSSTASAKFGFINVNSGNPTATISGNLSLQVPTGNNPSDLFNVLNGGTLNFQTSGGGDAGLSSRLFLANDGRVGINTTSPFPKTAFDVRGINGTGPAASISAATSFASLIVDNSGTGDLITASASGVPNFVVQNNGNVIVGQGGNGKITAGVLDPYLVQNQHTTGTTTLTLQTMGGTGADIIFKNGSSDLLHILQNGNIGIGVSNPTTAKLVVAGDIAPDTTGHNLGTASTPWNTVYANNIVGSGALGYWQQSNGVLFPQSSTVDFLLGGTATTSAKFAVLNMNSGTPVASVSSGLNGNSMYLTADGTLATQNRQSLTIGNSSTYNTTGNVLINPNGTGNVGIGTTTPTQKLDVSTAMGNGTVPFLASVVSDTTRNFRVTSGIISTGGYDVGGLWATTAAPTAANAAILADNSGNTYFNAATNAGIYYQINNTNEMQLTKSGGLSLGSTYYSTDPGAGNMIIQGNVGIGTTAPTAPLHVAGAYGSNAAVIINQLNSGDIFTASASGTTRLTLSNGGNLNLIGGVYQSGGTSGVSISNACVNTTGGIVTGTGTCPTGTQSSLFWNQSSGLLYPNNSTVDFALGGTSTSSAKFAVLNMNSGTPIASIAGTLSLGSTAGTTRTIGATAMNNLQLGDANTGGISLAPGGTTALFAQSGGNVGIGTTSPGYPLSVVATLASSDIMSLNNNAASGLGYSSIALLDSNGQQEGFMGWSNYGASRLPLSVYLGTTGTFPTILATNNTERMRITSTGNVGIGTNSPLGLLSVNGATTSNQGQALVQINQTSSGPIFTASQSGTTKFVIDNAGNVGIGTTSPQTALHVVGTISVEAGGGGYAAGYFTKLSSAYGPQPLLLSSRDGAVLSADNYGANTTLYANNAAALTILNGGNVGIGTTGPSSLLSVGSTSQFQVNSIGAIAAATGITSSGGITFSSFASNGGPLYTNGSGVLAQATAGTSAQCLLGGTTPSFGSCATGTSDSFWNQSSGLLYPNNSTVDFALGGTSTSSAKFAVLNMNSGTPTATVAGNFIVMPYTSGSNELGGTVGINTTTPAEVLEVRGSAFGQTLFGLRKMDGGLNFSVTDTGFTTAAGGISITNSASGISPVMSLTVGYSTATIGEIIKGIAGQTGDLTQWQNNSGTILTKVDANGNLSVGTSTSPTGGVATFNGNVGIGTTSPGSLLNLSSSVGDNTTTNVLRIDNTAGSATGRSALGFYQTGGTFTSAQISSNPGSGYGSSKLFFSVADASKVLQDRMVIDVSGNVGIGTTSPTALLDVAGAASVGGQLTFRSGTAQIQSTANQTLTLGGNTTGNISLSPLNGNGIVTNNGSLNVSAPGSTGPLTLNVGGTQVLNVWGNGAIVQSSGDCNVGGSLCIGPSSIFGSGSGNDLYSNADISLLPRGNNIYLNAGGGKTIVGSITPTGFFNVVGSAYGKALTILNETGTNDIFTASASGTTRLTLSNGGNLNLIGGVYQSGGTSGVTVASAACVTSTGGIVTGSAACPGGGGGSSNWTLSTANGTLSPNNNTLDLLLGGIATTSAKFAVLNMNSGTPIASIAGTLSLGSAAGTTRTIGATAMNNLQLGDANTGGVSLAPGGTTALFAQSGGNVGIGSTAPAYQLTLRGAGQTTAGMTDAGNKGGTLYLQDTGVGAGNGGAIVFGSDNNGVFAGIKGLLQNGGPAALGDLAFSTRNGTGDTALTERMRITYNGNVGIGTTGPGSLLTVGPNTSNQGQFTVNTTGAVTSAGTTGQVFFAGHQIGLSYSYGTGIFQATTDNLTGANNTYFQGVTGSTTNFSVRADGQGYFAGNVGIGTASPVAPLQVNGAYGSNAAAIINQLNSGNIFTASASGTTKLTLSNTGLLSLTGGQTSDLDTLSNTTLKIGATNATTITLGRTGQGITLPGFAGQNGVLYGTQSTGVLAQATTASSGLCLQSGASAPTWTSCGSVTSTNSPFQVVSGAIVPLNSTQDFLIGGQATASADFAVLNVNGAGPVIATVSGNLIVMPKNGAGGFLGIGTTSPTHTLEAWQTGSVGTENGTIQAYANNSTTSNAIVAFGNDTGNTSPGTTYSLAMLAGYDTNPTGLNNYGVWGHQYGSGSGGYGVLATNGAAPATASMYVALAGTTYAGIFMGGNVGIGTSTPGNLLQISQSGTGYTELMKVNNPGDPGNGATRLTVGNSQASFFLQAYGSGAPGSLASAASIYAATGSKLLLGASAGLPVQIFSNDNYANPQFTLSSAGNVGIGTTTPISLLNLVGGNMGGNALAIFNQTGALTNDIFSASSSGTTRFTIRNDGSISLNGAQSPTANVANHPMFQIYSTLGTAPAASISANTAAPALLVTNEGSGDLFVASGAGGIAALRIKANGSIVVSDGQNTTSSKITVATQDPLYTIDGKKYSTYVSSTLGIYEEMLSHAIPQYDSSAGAYAYKLDFNNATKGSDLWVFNRIIDPNITFVDVLITGSNNARVWYQKDLVNRTITLYADRPSEISYRLSGPRFDHENWSTKAKASDYDITGIIAPPPPPLSNGQNNNISVDPYFASLTINQQNGQWVLTDANHNNINQITAYSKAIIANIEAGFAHIRQLAVDNISAGSASLGNATAQTFAVAANTITIGGVDLKQFIINTVQQAGFIQAPIISPLAQIDTVQTNLISPLADNSTIAIGLNRNNISVKNTNTNQVVAQINDNGNASFAGTLSSNNASVSGTLASGSIQTNNATVSGTLNANNATIGQLNNTGNASIGGTLTAGNIIANNIQGLDSKIASIASNLIASNQNTAQTQPITSTASGQISNSQLLAVDTVHANFGIFEQGITSMGPITTNQMTATDQLAVGNSFTISNNAINTIGSDLELQSLRQGNIAFEGGKVRIDTDGNMSINGNLNVLGTIAATNGVFQNSVNTKALATSLISPLPNSDLVIKLNDSSSTPSGKLQIQNNAGTNVLSINSQGDIFSSGAAQFSKLNFNVVGQAQAISLDSAVATGSAGFATLRQGQPELTIQNPNVTSKSLIYITPFGDTNNKVLYLLRQVPNDPQNGSTGSFTVGISGQTAPSDIQFNWLIVN